MVALFVPLMALGLLVTASGARQINDIGCNEAIFDLLPCHDYLVGSSQGEPTPYCCQAANTIFQRADTTQVRRTLCVCFEQAFPMFGINPDQARQLPKLCNISLSFPIDPKLNCST